MLNGYTELVQNGTITKLSDFMKICMRAFGACIELKDEPLIHEDIKKFKVSDYHKNGLNNAYDKKIKFINTSNEELQLENIKEYFDALRDYNEILIEKAEMQEKYFNMLEKVKCWKPPTSKHIRFKDFMIEELIESIKRDCSLTHLKPPKKLTLTEYKIKCLQNINWSIDYHTKYGLEEINKINLNNKWIEQIYDTMKEDD